MANPIHDTIKHEMLTLLEETFTKVSGIYLDRGTSLLETIDGISWETASRQVHGIPETIAGHVFHLTFYMIVLQEYLTGQRTGKTNWDESWVVKAVSSQQWEDLKANLKREYQKMTEFVDQVDDWGKEDYLGGFIGIIAHCAFHLGIIRQMKDLSQKSA